MNLTPKQQAFVNEYLIDLNATQAAIRAGYSPKTAKEHAARLLSNVNVQKAIQEAMARRSERVKRTADDVLMDIQNATRRARENGDMKHEFRGLELEGKHLGMFTDRLKITDSLEYKKVEEMTDEEILAQLAAIDAAKRGLAS